MFVDLLDLTHPIFMAEYARKHKVFAHDLVHASMKSRKDIQLTHLTPIQKNVL